METLFADAGTELRNASDSRVFDGFTRRLLGIVLLQGLILSGVFVVGLWQTDERNMRSLSEVDRLHRVSDASRLLATAVSDAVVAPGQVQSQSIGVVAGRSTVRDAYAELVEKSRKTPLQSRVDSLKIVIDRWRHARGKTVAAPSRAPDVGGAEIGAVDAELQDAIATLAQTARNLAQERLVAGTAVAAPDLLVLGGLLFGVVSTASVAVALTARRFRRRTLGLPKRVETMIYDRNPVEAPGGLGVLSDPVELAAADFWTMAQKLRARLSENEKIERMAFTDPLTGLPNRRGLLAFLDMLAERTEDSGDDSKMGLVHIDLDHFKTINDTMGHDAGDTVLREATKRMSTAIRDSDLLARLGGDEFLVVATGIEHEGDLTRIADRLTDQFKSPIMYRARVCHVGVSMGLVLGGQRGRVRDPKRLLINADMALFRAKSLGRGQYAIFTSAMADEARQRNERSIALGKALQDDAFRPWFQPMLDLQDQSVTGLELLCRWHDEERGLVMPDGFIEDAEANSLMEEIGLRVLEHAISALQEWRLSGAIVPTVHLNLSRTQLLSSSFVDRLSWTLDEANLPPGQFAIEIDERDCSERGSEVVFANTRRMRNLGLQVVLDNFGAEQANLTILAPLGARMVKCSPALFERLLRDQSASDKVQSLAALENAADAFGILIGAKGVETREQSELLMAAGIHVQQGDFLAGVMDAEDTGRFLRGELDGVYAATQKAS